jgi:ferric-dicitrate binding protein FerR (iron transport regulator)
VSNNIDRLTHLFPRYWDSVLTVAEQQELERILETDPQARQALLLLSLQVVAPAELSAINALHLSPGVVPSGDVARWHLSRRRVLQLAGGGMALGLLGLAGLSWRYFTDSKPQFVELTSTRGVVRLDEPSSPQLVPGTKIPAGKTIRSYGHGSSALLTCDDGTTVSLTGDSSLTVFDTGRRLTLQNGTATAEVRPEIARRDPLVLATPRTALTSPGGAAVTLGSDQDATRVGVGSGQVEVSDRSGVRLADVSEGEILTVRADGGIRKQHITPTPETFAWDLRRPLPEGWLVGYRVVGDSGPVVRPQFWHDPYHSALLCQVRTDNQWTLGFVRLHPDSLIRVRYWVNEPGRGQLVMCVRTGDPTCSDTGVLEHNDAFVRSRPRAWQWLEVRAGDMLDNKHTPAFRHPWVAFFIIFNTYEVDIGLRIADLRVSRNGGSRIG